MPLTFAIADLHGRYDLLVTAYAAFRELYPDGPHTIVHLGDYVDRGPASMEVVRHLMDERTIPNGWRRIVLKGNHEDMMVETIREGLHPGWWIGNGGGATLVSYGHTLRGEYDPYVVPPEHVAFLATLPVWHEDTHRIYVHAGVPIYHAPMADQPEQKLMWLLYPDGADGGWNGKHVVHGHEQFADGPKHYAERTNLDTFAWLTGRLVIGVFDDDVPGGPIDHLVVRGTPHPLATKMDLSAIPEEDSP